MLCCAACNKVRMTAGNLYLIDDSFDDNTATNGAAVYAVQGCGQVSLDHTTPFLLFDLKNDSIAGA
jgi:hypothetical protein